MTRKIKVYQLGRKGLEYTEVDIEEAKQIIKVAASWGSIVIDLETKEIIWDIGPDTNEIEVVDMLAGG
jgi:hypothetical protein